MFKWLRGLSWAKIIGTDIQKAPVKKKTKKVHRKRIRKSKK